jgi:hypothetical protein
MEVKSEREERRGRGYDRKSMRLVNHGTGKKRKKKKTPMRVKANKNKTERRGGNA